MSLSFSVAMKTLLGFALLAITIVVVGAGGLAGISELKQQVQKISGQNLPELVSSFNQSLLIGQSNQALLIYLQSADKETKKLQLSEFEKNYQGYQQNLQQISSLKGSADNSQILAQVDQSSRTYHNLANTIVAQHQQASEIELNIVGQEQTLQANLDNINSLYQKLSQFVAADKKSLKALRKLNTSINQVQVAIRQYQVNYDLERLMQSAVRLNTQINAEFAAFTQVEAKAKFLKLHIEKLITLFAKDQGLLLSYQQASDLNLQLKANLSAAQQQLQLTQKSSDALIEIALHSTDIARETSLKTSESTTTLIISLILVALVVASVIAYLVVITIQRPMKDISRKLKLLGQGDMTTVFDTKRADEFGLLGIDLNVLVKELRSLLQQIIDKSDELESTANNNNTISHNTTQAMGQQSSQLSTIASSAVELESSVSQVAEQVQLTIDSANSCNDLSLNARQLVDDTAASIRQQAADISLAVQQSKQLQSESLEIDNILETIITIADQTNLLALNAAIEAARAGENGRGFSVVADEVRALASRTQQSTQEIQKTVESMKQQIGQVSKLLLKTHQFTDASVQLANDSGDSLQSLQQAIGVIQQMSFSITQTTKEQTNAVIEVSQNLEQLNLVAQRTAQGACDAETSSNQLLAIAQTQRELTHKFTL
ncbi:MAG: hypothetical protein OFPI_43210 [Osedax symbiont Rs2]|nr:MAG: hypothetical protein OFPI_43210 [Osedax symbiont Rs2]